MALIPKPHGEPMTLLTASTTETSLKAATATAVRGGSYVSLPAGSVPAGVEGSYVTVDGTPVVAASVTEGSYVTLPAAA